MLKELIDWYMASLETGGYALIALLMAIESSIVPLPSEVVIPPAQGCAWVSAYTDWCAPVTLVSKKTYRYKPLKTISHIR